MGLSVAALAGSSLSAAAVVVVVVVAAAAAATAGFFLFSSSSLVTTSLPRAPSTSLSLPLACALGAAFSAVGWRWLSCGCVPPLFTSSSGCVFLTSAPLASVEATRVAPPTSLEISLSSFGGRSGSVVPSLPPISIKKSLYLACLFSSFAGLLLSASRHARPRFNLFIFRPRTPAGVSASVFFFLHQHFLWGDNLVMSLVVQRMANA
jgi:hypothetical protein